MVTLKILFAWLVALVLVIGGFWSIVSPGSFLGSAADHLILEWIARAFGLIFLVVGILLFPAYYEDFEANAMRLRTKNPFSNWLILLGAIYSFVAYSPDLHDPM